MVMIYENSCRAVYRAESEVYGSVIVKINSNVEELHREAAMLKVWNGSGCCRLYAYEEEQGILLEEQFRPGTTLRKEKEVSKRAEMFVSVFEKMHGNDEKKIEEARVCKVNASETQSYLEWLADAMQFCEECMQGFSMEVKLLLQESELHEKMKRAYEIGEALFAKYPERVMLHGDLHHDNILKNSEGGYSVIDPKGVRGPEIFDVPRFVLNEFAYVKEEPTEAIKKHLKQVMQMIGERLGYPEQDIRRLLFMETILASVWSVEDGEEINETLIQVVEELGR